MTRHMATNTVLITNPLYSAHSLPPYHNAAFDHFPHPHDHRHPQRQSPQPRHRPSDSDHATLQVRPQKKFAENSTGLQKVKGPFPLSPLTPKEPRPPKKDDFGQGSSHLPHPDDPLPPAINDPSAPSATNFAETPVNDQIAPRRPPQPSLTPKGNKASFPMPFHEELKHIAPVQLIPPAIDGTPLATFGHLPGDLRPDPTAAAPPQPASERDEDHSKERFPRVPFVGERPSAPQEGCPRSAPPSVPLVHLSQPPAVRPSSPTPRPPTTNLTSQIDSPCQKTPSSTPLEGRTVNFRGGDFRFEDATTSPYQFPSVRPSSPTPRPPTADLTSQIDSAWSKTPSSTPLEVRTDDFRGVDFRLKNASSLRSRIIKVFVKRILSLSGFCNMNIITKRWYRY